MQSDVAQSIARKVEVTVAGEEQARLSSARPVSPEVYETCRKGRFAKSNSQQELERNIASFEEAISKDPTFAPAYVGLAGAYDSLATVFVGAPPEGAREKQTRAALKALELDSGNAEAHVLLAHVLRKQWHWANAEAEYKRALALNPMTPPRTSDARLGSFARAKRRKRSPGPGAPASSIRSDPPEPTSGIFFLRPGITTKPFRICKTPSRSDQTTHSLIGFWASH